MTNWYEYTSSTGSVFATDTNRPSRKTIARVTKWAAVFGLLLITATCGCSSHAIKDSPLASKTDNLTEATTLKRGSTTQLNDTSVDDASDEKYNTGWAVYLDNDVLTTGDRDQDYTGGLAVTLSGRRATEYLISVDSWLNGLDRFLGVESLYEDKTHFERHSFEFGLTLFTPRDISIAEPIPDDRPYASLFFIANTKQTVVHSDSVSYQTTLAVGLLGLDIAEDIQRFLHDTLGGEESNGWDNQISSGGEPTAKYTVSRQKTHFDRTGPTGIGYEFKTSMEGSVGFSTDVNTGFSLRWGRIHTPWWSFNPHQAEYISLGSPVNGNSDKDSRKEFFLWAGANVKYRFYNAILQGQFRDSAVTFDYSELEHVIAEAWIGVTKELGAGFSSSLFIRGCTNEIEANGRRPVWGGIIISRAF